MPISGPKPTDGDNSSQWYEVIIKIIRNRIKEHFENLPNDPIFVNKVLAALQSLRIVASGVHACGHLSIATGLVIQWREQFLEWIEKIQIPEKRKAEFCQAALEEFEILEDVSSKMPKFMW